MAVGVLGRQSARATEGLFVVGDYGALGAADDTATINAAINAASAAGGGTVLLPQGTFLVTMVVMKSNVVLRGAGYGTVLKVRDGANGASISAVMMDNASFASIRDLRIEGNMANQVEPADPYYWGYGIGDSSFASNDCLIDNVWINNTLRTGIFLMGNRNTVRGCKITNCGSKFGVGRSGIVFGSDVPGTKGRILNNTISNTFEHAIKLYNGYDGCLISGNDIDTANDGIIVYGCSKVQIVNNAVASTLLAGIKAYTDAAGLAQSGISILGNKVVTAVGAGIELVATTVLFTNCQVNNNNVAAATTYGIRVTSAPGCQVNNNECTANGLIGIGINNSSDCVVVGNVCTDNGTVAVSATGILGEGTSSHVVCSGNRCSATALALSIGIRTNDTCDYWAITGNDVTGNPNIGTYTTSGTHHILGNNINGTNKSRNSGVASVANAGTIAHGLEAAPTRYGLTGTVAKRLASVTAVSATLLTIALHDDTGAAIAAAENVAWWAEV